MKTKVTKIGKQKRDMRTADTRLNTLIFKPQIYMTGNILKDFYKPY